ncbi:MAG: transporter substrate-binding domain-containing protein [Cyclobacteriaceae bacterium]|nr:transporter substrate-binding domain-containing protein [Cyclobacteriaceae bacterium]
MRTSFYFFSAVLLLLSCTTTDHVNVEETDTSSPPILFDLDQIKERGRLTAIVDNSSTSYFIYRGQPMGYEYELLQRFCEKIGVELEIKITTSINEAFDMLNKGEGDIIAFFLTVTNERKKKVAFSHYLFTSRQVLVQKKPSGWQKMYTAQRDKHLIRDQVELIEKKVNVRKSSAFVQRLRHLSEEIGGDIIIVEESEELETEDLIRKVLNEEIALTVADEAIALVNAAFYPDLDVETPISFPQQIAWAMRKNAPALLYATNTWLDEIKSSSLHSIIYNRYFKVSRNMLERAQSDFSSISGNRISEYDEIIRQASDSLGWDWKMVASIIYQESRFQPKVQSWAGARGLMQLMPATGQRFGASNLQDPHQNILAGTRYLQYLDKYWKKHITDSTERTRFVLASYNAGLGHVQDAVALANAFEMNPNLWGNHVSEALKMKAKPRHFRHEVVKYGYCRGEAITAYVDEVIKRYEQYCQLIE